MALGQPRIEYKTNSQILKMREAGLVLAEALDEASAAARPGVTTKSIDAIFAKVLERHGATSNFLGYHGFPASICASVNHEVVHGFPATMNSKMVTYSRLTAARLSTAGTRTRLAPC